jgi:hypothetical protein
MVGSYFEELADKFDIYQGNQETGDPGRVLVLQARARILSSTGTFSLCFKGGPLVNDGNDYYILHIITKGRMLNSQSSNRLQSHLKIHTVSRLMC